MSTLTALLTAELEHARHRTLGLLEPVPEAHLVRQHSPLMSPLIWDLAHIANYEDIWLLRALGADGVGARYDALYDALLQPRPTRGQLAALDPAAARAYGQAVRAGVLDRLDTYGAEGDDPLQVGAFVYRMVIQHEHQHDETLLAALHLLPDGYDGRVGKRSLTSSLATPLGECAVPGGRYVIGTSIDPWAFDNESPAHTVEVAPFVIDEAPVTNAAWMAFLAEGGYQDARHWSDKGWAWRIEARLEGPMDWMSDGGGGWQRNRFGRLEAVPADEPVQHVCWYEADAFARWAGRRLPTEVEWEVAATCDPVTGTKRRHPWGDEPWRPEFANLGQERFGPDPVGAHPQGRSAVGCLAMEGDVWEWTSSGFTPWPGTVAFPYREYSEVFYGGDYKVLRGGSWATSPLACRGTFRNWDHPIRRQIFAGLRTARDSAGDA